MIKTIKGNFIAKLACAVLLAGLFAGCEEKGDRESGLVSYEKPVSVRLVPSSVSFEKADGESNIWKLFDRDTTTAFTTAEPVTIRYELSSARRITRLCVYGKSPYRVQVFSADDDSAPL